MRSKLTIDDIRRLAKGGIPADEMNAGMAEFYRDDTEVEGADLRYIVPHREWEHNDRIRDHEVARHSAILHSGGVIYHISKREVVT